MFLELKQKSTYLPTTIINSKVTVCLLPFSRLSRWTDFNEFSKEVNGIREMVIVYLKSTFEAAGKLVIDLYP